MRLSALAKALGCAVDGHGDVEITRVAGLEDAGPGDLTFLSNSKYGKHVAGTRASAIIAGASLTTAPCPIIRSQQPYVTFADALALIAARPTPPAGIHASAVVDASARVPASASIGPFVVIGAGTTIGERSVVLPHVSIGAGVTIGADCLIHAHVSIREDVSIGDRVILQDAAVIGSDGFGFARRADGTHQKIPQVGRVVIEDDVEIGAHSAVDRPAVGETRIGAGTKIDNLVQIAHGVKLGERVLLAALVGLAGSTILEDDVIFAGQSGATGHLRVGKGTIVAAKSGVTHDWPAGSAVSGFPAFDMKEWKKASVELRRLGRARRSPKR
jgi:UDP-3-O-[3-hydroxymyristoyl] glucosamine N-acyltransferase